MIFAERAAVHSVLPVYVQIHETREMPGAATETRQLLGPGFQKHFVMSLKSELVQHGIFGSIAESGGDDIFEIHILFTHDRGFSESARYELTAALATEFRGERELNQYHVISMNDAGMPADAPAATGNRQQQVATELMNLMMRDIQASVVLRKVRLKTHVKERQMDNSRMLVKW